MADITIVTGVYKSTYNWGAPHCMNFMVPSLRLSPFFLQDGARSHVGLVQ